MTINDLLKGWLFHGEEGTASGGRVICTGNSFINYRTVIAVKRDGKLYLNKVKYSSTTSRKQSYLKRIADNYGMEVVEVTEEEVNNLYFHI